MCILHLRGSFIYTRGGQPFVSEGRLFFQTRSGPHYCLH